MLLIAGSRLQNLLHYIKYQLAILQDRAKLNQTMKIIRLFTLITKMNNSLTEDGGPKKGRWGSDV